MRTDDDELNGKVLSDVIADAKHKRTWKRKPWVYRSEHDRILSFWKRWAYGWMFIAITNWIVWIIAILTK